MKNESIKNLIFYEIYPTSFYDSNNDGIGDLRGITLKLDYIKELGCNALWLNPFYLSPFKDGGYDVKDFKKVDPRFGTLDDFKELLEEAHKRGMKVLIDCVAGHTSEEHPYFIESGKEEHNEYSDLFIWTNDVWNYNPKYKLISGRHPRNGNYMVNFFSFQPALNFGFKDIDDPSWQMYYQDPRTFKAREFVIDFVCYWLSIGVDGFRVDMADSLVKNDDNKEATIEVWQYMFSKIKEKYPNSIFISEWANPWQSLKAGFDSDFVLDHWDNYYHYFIRADEYSRGPSVLNGGDLSFFITNLKEWYQAARDNEGYLSNITGNHDVLRLTHYASVDKIKIYFMFMMFMPGIPFIYYGDEIGMGYKVLPNKDGGYQRVGSRTPMQWDHSKNDGFSSSDTLYLPVNTASEITVSDNIINQNSLYHFLKRMIEFRKSHEETQEDNFEIEENNRVIRIYRCRYELVMNLSNEDVVFDEETIISTGANKKLEPYQAAIIHR